ncbi:hypothetical protein FOMPIDRAFT_1021016 [Fomitopsis schrenkii]|uniref:Uncharacterized protein n=1 Tax=Fomitopsis schrenkii TaxID=2126942 RepID=S8DFX6_FOMSC|nr:hypothetical protein FOMPIDRAFT_1021016 [Fomitopsis schrenkii]
MAFTGQVMLQAVLAACSIACLVKAVFQTFWLGGWQEQAIEGQTSSPTPPRSVPDSEDERETLRDHQFTERQIQKRKLEEKDESSVPQVEEHSNGHSVRCSEWNGM